MPIPLPFIQQWMSLGGERVVAFAVTKGNTDTWQHFIGPNQLACSQGGTQFYIIGDHFRLWPFFSMIPDYQASFTTIVKKHAMVELAPNSLNLYKIYMMLGRSGSTGVGVIIAHSGGG